LNELNGRSVVLWPYGVLFRESEKEMRRKMIEDDIVECVIALGKNLFYNSIMESCLLVTNNNKIKSRKGKVLFIDARDKLKKEKTISYLLSEHINLIYENYSNFKTDVGFSYVAEHSEILSNDSSLNIPLYVKNSSQENLNPNLVFENWKTASKELKKSINNLFEII
jgi:type I restriction enzyme M protein